jgi:hypothetical protein
MPSNEWGEMACLLVKNMVWGKSAAKMLFCIFQERSLSDFKKILAFLGERKERGKIQKEVLGILFDLSMKKYQELDFFLEEKGLYLDFVALLSSQEEKTWEVFNKIPEQEKENCMRLLLQMQEFSGEDVQDTFFLLLQAVNPYKYEKLFACLQHFCFSGQKWGKDYTILIFKALRIMPAEEWETFLTLVEPYAGNDQKLPDSYNLILSLSEGEKDLLLCRRNLFVEESLSYDNICDITDALRMMKESPEFDQSLALFREKIFPECRQMSSDLKTTIFVALIGKTGSFETFSLFVDLICPYLLHVEEGQEEISKQIEDFPLEKQRMIRLMQEGGALIPQADDSVLSFYLLRFVYEMILDESLIKDACFYRKQSLSPVQLLAVYMILQDGQQTRCKASLIANILPNIAFNESLDSVILTLSAGLLMHDKMSAQEQNRLLELFQLVPLSARISISRLVATLMTENASITQIHSFMYFIMHFTEYRGLGGKGTKEQILASWARQLQQFVNKAEEDAFYEDITLNMARNVLKLHGIWALQLDHDLVQQSAQVVLRLDADRPGENDNMWYVYAHQICLIARDQDPIEPTIPSLQVFIDALQKKVEIALCLEGLKKNMKRQEALQKIQTYQELRQWIQETNQHLPENTPCLSPEIFKVLL